MAGGGTQEIAHARSKRSDEQGFRARERVREEAVMPMWPGVVQAKSLSQGTPSPYPNERLDRSHCSAGLFFISTVGYESSALPLPSIFKINV